MNLGTWLRPLRDLSGLCTRNQQNYLPRTEMRTKVSAPRRHRRHCQRGDFSASTLQGTTPRRHTRASACWRTGRPGSASFETERNSAEALKHAEAAATTSPNDIAAQIALGDSRAKRNDVQGALAAYQLALQNFYNQSSPPYEPPSLLLYQRAMLRERRKHN